MAAMTVAVQIRGAASLDADEREAEPIAGLRAFWASLSGAGPAPPAQQTRLMLATLGLGIEQAARHVSLERPGFAAFVRWVEDTAGTPDPVAVARYHAWRNGEPIPEPAAARQRAVDAAPSALGPADLAQWERDGYVVLRGAITPEQAAGAAALLWRTIDADPANPDTWYGPRTNGIMIQLFQHPALEAARRSARVRKAFAQLWRTADLWMLTDRMSFNPPERPGEPFAGPHLHWDVSLSPPIPFATQGILYLTDTAADQGALQLVPGFHHRIGRWLAELGERDPRLVDLSAEAITVPAGAGDLVIWRQDLPHGASANTADRPRLAQYVNMVSGDLTDHPVWR